MEYLIAATVVSDLRIGHSTERSNRVPATGAARVRFENRTPREPIHSVFSRRTCRATQTATRDGSENTHTSTV
jgi:hypothetical protein